MKPPSEGPPHAGAARLRPVVNERDDKVNYNELNEVYLTGLLFNKYDDREHNSSQGIRKIGKDVFYPGEKELNIYAGRNTGDHFYIPKDKD